MFGGAECVLAAALAFLPSDARNAHSLVSDFTRKCPVRDAGSRGAHSAAGYIASHLKTLGAAPVLDRFAAPTPIGVRTFVNVSAEWRFEASGDAPWIVLTSHYDTKCGCPGANDGASTSALLLAFASALNRSESPGFNIQLLWLDGEECMKAYLPGDGFWGSKRAAEKLKESGRRVKAVICLDMLGDADLNISIPRNVTPSLSRVALAAAAQLEKRGFKNKVSTIRELVKDDHQAFLEQGFPAIDLIDFDYGGKKGENRYWHTTEDTPDKVSAESILYSARLVVGMIEQLAVSPKS